MKIYLPSWYGDFRLEGDGEKCKLILHDLTDHERLIIGNFLRTCKQKGWAHESPPPKQAFRGNAKGTIAIDAPLHLASKELIKASRPKDRTITAVKFSDGGMEVIEGTTEEGLLKVAAAIKKGADSEDSKAVAVKRPTPSCPTCMPGAIEPATEALLSFLGEQEHIDWSEKRAIVVTGGFSGHQYVLAHRKSNLAHEIGKVCFDLDDEMVVHFHDSGVPPEEEILAAKLILEHREPWLRNEATCFGPNATEVYKNPFGDMGDGVESASFSQGFGLAIKSFMRN